MEFKKRVALALLIGAAGCSSNNDIKTSEIADTSASLSGALIRELGSSTGFLADLTALNSALDQIPVGAVGVPGATAAPLPPPPPAPVGALRAAAAPLLTALQPAPTTSNPLLSAGRWFATTATGGSTGASTDQAASEFETFLRTRIFTDGNRESGNSHSATFRLRGAAICTDGTYAPNPTCVSTVDDLDLRITATKAGDGFDFQFLVGPTKANPISLGLRSGSASISFDLGAIKAAAQHIETVTGVTITLPAVMEGAFRFALNKLGQAHMSFVVSVLSAIHVRVDATDGSYDFTTQAASSLLAFDADAVGGALSAGYGLGATTFSMPYVGNVAAASPSGFTTFGVALGGFSYTIRATVATPDVVEITGIGLGSTQTRVWARKADNTIVDAITVDLLDGAGGPTTLDLTVASNPSTGDATLTTTPFELSVFVGLGLLDLDTPVAAGSGAVSDTYDFALAAGTGGADPQLFLPAACDVVADPICINPPPELLVGSLTFSATGEAGDATIAAAEGQCLYDDGTGTHPVLGMLRADVCL